VGSLHCTRPHQFSDFHTAFVEGQFFPLLSHLCTLPLPCTSCEKFPFVRPFFKRGRPLTPLRSDSLPRLFPLSDELDSFASQATLQPLSPFFSSRSYFFFFIAHRVLFNPVFSFSFQNFPLLSVLRSSVLYGPTWLSSNRVAGWSVLIGPMVIRPRFDDFPFPDHPWSSVFSPFPSWKRIIEGFFP